MLFKDETIRDAHGTEAKFRDYLNGTAKVFFYFSNMVAPAVTKLGKYEELRPEFDKLKKKFKEA